MNLILLLTFFATLYLFALVRRILEKRPGPKTRLGYLDFNEKYLSRNRKIPSIKILRLYSQIDTIMIRSLFDSAKRIIVDYVNFNRAKNRKNYKFDIRQIAEILVLGYSVPAGKNRNLPEILV